MSNDQNNASNDDDTPLREDQEEQVLWEFRNVFQDLHGRLLDDPYVLTDQEHLYLENLYADPTLYCAAAGLATFGLLKSVRGLRNYTKQRRFRQLQERQQSSGYSMEVPPQGTASFPPPPHNGNAPPTTAKGIRRFLTWANLLDVSISSFTGIAAGAYLMDMHEAEAELGQVPLMPGPSSISDAFCPVLLEEYQRHVQMAKASESVWESNTTTEYNFGMLSVKLQEELLSPDHHKDILENPQNPNLRAYLDFARNCHKRQVVERRIRQEAGLAPDSAVSIPEPGVEAYYNPEDDDGDDGFTPDQVTSWVSDQEDDS